MTVQAVQVAERRVIRALRLVALILVDSSDDMCGITNRDYEGTPPEIWEARTKAWNRVSGFLRRLCGIITQIQDNNGPAFENAVDLAEKCEAAIKEIEEQWRLTRDQDFRKKLAKDEAILRAASVTPRS